jgi:succinate dehydrogenase/fumarate reductase cytochrome b subunit
MNETPYWTWHLITGIIVLLLLGLHMLIMHLDGVLGLFNSIEGSATSWENVLYRSKTLCFTLTYILLLGAALYHGLYGLRTIIFELNPPTSLQNFINKLFWIGGICLFIVGTYGSIVIFKQ